MSGSSGRLVVEKVATTTTEVDYPGLVFAEETLSYTEAMLEFVHRSKAKMADKSHQLEETDRDKVDFRAKKGC